MVAGLETLVTLRILLMSFLIVTIYILEITFTLKSYSSSAYHQFEPKLNDIYCNLNFRIHVGLVYFVYLRHLAAKVCTTYLAFIFILSTLILIFITADQVGIRFSS